MVKLSLINVRLVSSALCCRKLILQTFPGHLASWLPIRLGQLEKLIGGWKVGGRGNFFSFGEEWLALGSHLFGVSCGNRSCPQASAVPEVEAMYVNQWHASVVATTSGCVTAE